MYQHTSQRRHSSSASSIASASSWESDNDDCAQFPSRRPSLNLFGRDTRSRQTSTSSATPTSASNRTCEGMTSKKTRELWRCMLELQQRYGCYNSTRIDLAVNAGDGGIDLMPNPFIIDTLNDSVIDLPDEGREMLDRCLQQRKPSLSKKPKRKMFSRA